MQACPTFPPAPAIAGECKDICVEGSQEKEVLGTKHHEAPGCRYKFQLKEFKTAGDAKYCTQKTFALKRGGRNDVSGEVQSSNFVFVWLAGHDLCISLA